MEVGKKRLYLWDTGSSIAVSPVDGLPQAAEFRTPGGFVSVTDQVNAVENQNARLGTTPPRDLPVTSRQWNPARQALNVASFSQETKGLYLST